MESDTATLLFTRMMLEQEIKNVQKRITTVRNDPNMSDVIKSIELVRLFEVVNNLEVEATRKQEEYMQVFLGSLKLEEIGAKPMFEGRCQRCHLSQQVKPRKITPRTISCGFYDSYCDKPGRMPVSMSSNSVNRASGILTQRRGEIRDELMRLNYKSELTSEESQRQKELTAELQNITK